MAINTKYIVKSTQGTLPGNPSLTINVGTSSGPSELTQVADLTFYGYGRAGWGQEVDQNFYRLLENFACEQNGSNLIPKSKAQLGAITDGSTSSVLGVNKPVLGQTWYNLTDSELYVCSDTTPDTWRHLISEPFANVTYLKIVDASGTGPNAFLKLDGSNSPMTGPLFLDGNPSAPNQASTKDYVDDQIATVTSSSSALYIHKSGDTEIGNLTLQAGTTGPYTFLRQGNLEIGRADGTTYSPYFDFHSNGSSITDYDCRITSTGGTAGTPGQGTLSLIGYIVTDGRTPTLPNQVTTKAWVENAISTAVSGSSSSLNTVFVKRAGDSMTGILDMNSNRITELAAPITDTDATTRGYVRQSFYAPPSTGSNNNITISTAAPSGGTDGDIWFQY